MRTEAVEKIDSTDVPHVDGIGLRSLRHRRPSATSGGKMSKTLSDDEACRLFYPDRYVCESIFEESDWEHVYREMT